MKFLFFVISQYLCNYYAILGVQSNITQKRLEKAYKKKLLQLHPDRFTNPDEKARAQGQYTLAQEAFEVLSNPRLKNAYDRGGKKMVDEVKK